MTRKVLKCEADKNNKYYKIIQMNKKYYDGRKFLLDEIITSTKKVNLEATEISDMGGFFISTYEYIFRWLIRGDTLCEVKIPEESIIYKTGSKDGIYISENIILTNPIKINDNLAMKLYLNSKLSENSYFKAMTSCAIRGYINTALKVCEERVNKENVDSAILEFESFCKRREEEKYDSNVLEIEAVKIIYDKLKKIQTTKNN